MKKLKVLLQSKYVLIFFVIITVIYVGTKVRNIPYNEEFLDNTIVEGFVKSVDDKSIIVDNSIVYFNENISLGDRVRCIGTYELPSQNTNFYTFNYQKFLASKKVYYIMYGNCEVIHHSKSIISKVKKIIESYFDAFKSKNYLYAFILGNTNFINNDILNSYRLNGVNHLFSISGMHIGFIISILSFIKKKWLIAIILLFYLVLLGFTSSMTRAVFFFCLVLVNKKIGLDKKVLFLYLLMAMLVYNPFYIYDVGFIYSYLITFFLIIYSEFFTSKNYFKNLLKISIIIFIITIPINIQNNHYLNFLSPFFNMLFIPIVTYLLFPMSFIIMLLPFLDNGYYLICSLFENLSLNLSKVDIFLCSFKHMNLLVFLLYYMVIIIALNKIKFKEYNYFIILVIFLLLHFMFPYIDKNGYVYFLDIGQGDSALIKFPNNKLNILIDTGGLYSSKLIDNITVPFLRALGINKIDYLLLTHGDYDHMGEAINLVNNFKVDKVIFNCGPFNDLEQELIKVLDKKNIKYYSCIKELNIDNNKLYFLQTKEYDNENDNSNVIYTELDGYKFMFMGDAGVTTEKEIMNKYNLQDIDVLKVGHHGSKTSSGKDFINEINPKYSIISVGKNNRYGHPNKEVLENLKSSKTYRTDENGSIMFKIKDNKLKIETCTPQKGEW